MTSSAPMMGMAAVRQQHLQPYVADQKATQKIYIPFHKGSQRSKEKRAWRNEALTLLTEEI